MSKKNTQEREREYQLEKQRITLTSKTSEEYEQRIRKLVKRLKV